MKKTIIILAALFIPHIYGITQDVIVVKGKTYFHEFDNPAVYTEVYFNSKNRTFSNKEGEFIFSVKKRIINKSLKVAYIGCFDLKIKNLPANQDTIDLGVIPIFEYFPGYSMIHFDCKDDDQDCMKKRKLHEEKEAKRIEDYYNYVDNQINKYEYRFKSKTYKINVKSGVINLKKGKE